MSVINLDGGHCTSEGRKRTLLSRSETEVGENESHEQLHVGHVFSVAMLLATIILGWSTGRDAPHKSI